MRRTKHLALLHRANAPSQLPVSFVCGGRLAHRYVGVCLCLRGHTDAMPAAPVSAVRGGLAFKSTHGDGVKMQGLIVLGSASV